MNGGFVADLIASSQSTLGFAQLSPSPGQIVFYGGNKPVLVIHPDGRIEATADASPDEAAKLMLSALEHLLLQSGWVQHPPNEPEALANPE